jgi:Type VI secretion system, TssF
MDPRLLRYYNLELQHLREMGAEFAQQFPKIAARLGMNGLEVADPYVERLIEGVAFLAARVQLKLDAEFPRDHLPALPGAHAVDAGRAAPSGSWRSQPGVRSQDRAARQHDAGTGRRRGCDGM